MKYKQKIGKKSLVLSLSRTARRRRNARRIPAFANRARPVAEQDVGIEACDQTMRPDGPTPPSRRAGADAAAHIPSIAPRFNPSAFRPHSGITSVNKWKCRKKKTPGKMPSEKMPSGACHRKNMPGDIRQKNPPGECRRQNSGEKKMPPGIFAT